MLSMPMKQEHCYEFFVSETDKFKHKHGPSAIIIINYLKTKLASAILDNIASWLFLNAQYVLWQP